MHTTAVHPSPASPPARSRLALGLATTLLATGGAVVVAGTAGATPGSGVAAPFTATGVLDEPLRFVSRGHQPTRVIVQQLTLGAGGTTGWHTHPGPVLVVVKEGTFTVRQPHRGACVVRQFAAGQVFLDDGSVHEGRNNGTASVVLGVTYLLPDDGSTPRIDATVAPAPCS